MVSYEIRERIQLGALAIKKKRAHIVQLGEPESRL